MSLNAAISNGAMIGIAISISGAVLALLVVRRLASGRGMLEMPLFRRLFDSLIKAFHPLRKASRRRRQARCRLLAAPDALESRLLLTPAIQSLLTADTAVREDTAPPVINAGRDGIAAGPHTILNAVPEHSPGSRELFLVDADSPGFQFSCLPTPRPMPAFVLRASAPRRLLTGHTASSPILPTQILTFSSLTLRICPRIAEPTPFNSTRVAALQSALTERLRPSSSTCGSCSGSTPCPTCTNSWKACRIVRGRC